MNNPFSSTISRKTLLGAVGVATIGAIGKNVHDYNQGEQSAYFLKDTAYQLTQERQLVTQYLQFKEGFQDEGHDMSQYSLWNATQHLGLIHALAETNKNPLVSSADAFRTADSISTMHNEILDTPRPNYSENVENAEP
jgi:hypothetical protein